MGFAFHDGTAWNSDYTPGGTIPRNQWSQVGVTYDAAGHFQTYLNGQPVGDDALIEGLTVNFAASIGFVGNIGGSHQPFQGRMDNVVFYDNLLSPAQMATLHGTEDLSLHLHYTLDEPPGSNVFLDSAGIYGDASCTNCPVMGIRGAVNRAAYFDGDQINGIANAPDHWRNDYYATKWTAAFWLKAEYGRVLENKSVVLPFRIWTNRIEYGRDCCVPDFGNGNEWPAPDPAEWAHVVISYDQDDPSTGGIFINGQQIEAGGSILIRELFGPSPFRLGGSLKGYVDDVRLYNRAFSAADALEFYETTRPALQYEFEEDATAVSFTDLSPNAYDGAIVNAIPGLAGRIGNGVEFNGGSYVDAGVAANINNMTDALTIMAWVRPDQSISEPQLLIGAGLENSANGFAFGIEGDALWLSDGVTTVSSGDIGLLTDTWQQVAVKVGADGTTTFYLDGDPVGTGGVVALVANTDDHLYLGGRPLTDGTIGDYYFGQVDELFIYARALPNTEIGSAYDNQFRWFRKQFDTYLVVDNDVPTITLQTSEQYWPNSYIQLAVGTADATSAIWSFEYGLQAPGEPGFTWQAAPACADVSTGTVWCPYFDPAAMAGEGEYQLQFRAVDAVGNETVSLVYSLYVDDSAPVITSDDNGSWRSLTPDANTELGWKLPLSGTVSDPTLMGGIAGSGVYTPSVMVQLINKAGRPLSTPQLAAVNGTNWSLDYEILGRPHGRFYLRITAEDAVGNSSTLDLKPTGLQLLSSAGELLLDARPPSVDNDSWLLPDDVISQVVTLSGATSELPIWGSAVARYHFEETSGTTIYDHSTLDNHATCSNCPSAVAGPLGRLTTLTE
ncbi:MAG: LamG-like jellyroll fold domain-containing protein [Chloroflexota bacterium]